MGKKGNDGKAGSERSACPLFLLLIVIVIGFVGLDLWERTRLRLRLGWEDDGDEPRPLSQ